MSQGTSLAQLLTSRKLLFVTGKGGIGKTLVSVAMAQAAAAAGLRVLLVESSSRDQIAPLFGLDPVGHNETVAAPGISCINLNTAGNFREYITKYLGKKKMFDTVFSHRVVQSFFNTVPGLAEAMMLGRLYYTCDVRDVDLRPDLVIFDSPASGHFLSLMTTPDAIVGSGLAGPMLRDTQKVRDFLRRKDDVGVIYVCTPEPLVVSEAMEFLPVIQEKSPAKLCGVVVNRIPPSLGMGADSQNTAHGAGESRLLNFLRERAAKSAAALDMVRVSTQQFPGIMYLGLRDLGFVDDPLPADFHRTFLTEEALHP
ncbi:MAG: hypothetical protein EBU49_08760 [Proteobacteria bacterium]|nr:hypothetical protein [Pseudomonadota bacterium]